jgi:hypothetical protein
MSFDAIARKNLLDIALAYHKATGKSLSEIGREFYGRGSFFTNLQKGKQQQLASRSIDSMLREFRKRWPEKADWPYVKAIFMTREPMD